MKKSKISDEIKPESRKPSAEHLARIEMTERAALEAQAALGRGFLELLGIAQQVQVASENARVTHTKAAISVGIDPDGVAPWAWNSAARSYVKKG